MNAKSTLIPSIFDNLCRLAGKKRKSCGIKIINKLFIDAEGVERLMVQTNTVGKLAKKLKVEKRMILQWEEEFRDFLEVKRGANNTRIFSENDVQLLREIKQLTLQNMESNKIKEHLLQKTAPVEPETPATEQSLTAPSKHVENVEAELVQVIQNYKDVFEALESFKQDLLQEVREGIRNEVRAEVLQEVKREISKGVQQTAETVETFASFMTQSSEQTAKELHQIAKGNEQTVKTVENVASAVKKSSAQTAKELSQLAKGSEQTVKTVESVASAIKKSSEQTVKELNQLSKEAEHTTKTVEEFTSFMIRSSEQTTNELQEISKDTQQTFETIDVLSSFLAKSSEQTAKGIHQISNRLNQNHSTASSEIKELLETMNQERDYYLKTLEQERQFYRQDITERETIFRDFVQTFREAAAAEQPKQKKWWKSWL
ncbi:MerR family transcriptional regulator [Priestia abyssalis]|uniref:MerR family transcriptional regulator n=1 Tax=Priestia abyssalis TaxID=1221450 RepID=UPI000994E67E|nr:MerR family transcriptional regulator [Priestia abyssalis]